LGATEENLHAELWEAIDAKLARTSAENFLEPNPESLNLGVDNANFFSGNKSKMRNGFQKPDEEEICTIPSFDK